MCGIITVVLFTPQQMRNLLCKRLAAYLCMKQSPSSSLEPPIIYRKAWNVDLSNGSKGMQGFQYDNLIASSTGTMENDETKKLLKRMCHLMETRVHKEEEQRYDDDRENAMKNDWMLAAAVLDRICAIAVTVIYIVGTVSCYVVFAIHP